MLLELLAERKTVRVPQLKGQLLQRQIAAQQQRLGAVHPDANGVLADGDSGGSPELLPQGFVAQVHLGGNLLSGNPPGVALDETAGQPDAVVLLPVHHRAVRHQVHGQEIVIALRADADEKFQPLSVRLYEILRTYYG